MNWLKILPFIGSLLTLGGTLINSFVQDKKMSLAVKAEVEKAMKTKK